MWLISPLEAIFILLVPTKRGEVKANETHIFEKRTKAAAGGLDGVTRNYTLADVERLSGTVEIEHSLDR